MIQAIEKYNTFQDLPSVETKDISEARLPTIFICNKDVDVVQTGKFLENGYTSAMTNFLLGRVNGSTAILSWEGNNSIPYQNLTKEVLKPISKTSLVIKGNPMANWNFYKDHRFQQLTILDGFCSKIDINNTKFPHSNLFNADLSFFDSFLLYIADPGKCLHYKIDTDSLAGDNIAVDKYSKSKIYTVKFEEIHWDEESGECTNYGEGEEFKTYADCVAHEQDKIFQPILECQVPWLAGPDNPGACKGKVPIPEDKWKMFKEQIEFVHEKIKYLKMTHQYENCLKSCVELRAHSRLKSIKSAIWRRTVLSFQKVVRVTRYQRAYDLFDLVVEVGSSLGLWIGLSALGIFDLFLFAGDIVKQKIMSP